ncbi:hypothetical protein [Myxosarcina sp. GI1(2024)]
MPENHQQDSGRTTNNSDLSEKANSERFFVVGIGASAGGLKALEELFANLPIDS